MSDTNKQAKSNNSNITEVNVPAKNQICAGNDSFAGIKWDGSVLSVGKNDFGQCNTDEWEHVVALSKGEVHTLGLAYNGKV